MNKQELRILERAFSAEIDAALNKNICGLIQTKSKVAESLCADGYLRLTTHVLRGQFSVYINGYELTELGRLAYCTSDLCIEEQA